MINYYSIPSNILPEVFKHFIVTLQLRVLWLFQTAVTTIWPCESECALKLRDMRIHRLCIKSVYSIVKPLIQKTMRYYCSPDSEYIIFVYEMSYFFEENKWA